MLAAVPAFDCAAARAQPGVPKIGWLKIQRKSDTPGWLAAFRKGLDELGRREGSGYLLEERYADGDAKRLDALAGELVAAGVAVIVATSQPAADAARRVTRSVPIVARMTDDPVAAGAALSLAHPGGNLTGIYSLLEETNGKRLALLKQAAPSLTRVGALLTFDRGATRHWLAEAETAAGALGLELLAMDVHGPDDLPAAFAAAAGKGANGLIAFRNPTVVTFADRVIALSMQHRMPGVFDAREFADAGGFISYGPNLDALFRRAAAYADKILRGEACGDLPIEQPAAIELVVNLKTAKAMGLSVPPTFLSSADDVIE
jgi:putative ABC transport system substrate-binding protein